MKKSDKKRVITFLLILLALVCISRCNNRPSHQASEQITHFDVAEQPAQQTVQVPPVQNTPQENAAQTSNTAENHAQQQQTDHSVTSASAFDYSEIPETDGITPYVEVNDDIPFFMSYDIQRTDPFETYSSLDDLGRCGVAYANICVELMPTQKRGDISSIKPTGWKQAKYPDLITTQDLYNRCHLIGHQLAGEDANRQNLITGTRYLNVTGMLVFEDQIASYIKNHPNNHVLYRVTPVFIDSELVARGVLMEARSVEDNGELEFCVYCYNIQPGIEIDYKTGKSWRVE